MAGIFVTGTDTDVGKTVATTLLIEGFLQRGYEVIPYKPVQSGAERKQTQWVAPDAEMYRYVNDFTTHSLYTYLFPYAASPHLAAEKEAKTIDVVPILEQFVLRQQRGEFVIAEGAGGLFVPLNRDGDFMIDLMRAVNLPIVIVARASLGTINHTILTVEALQKRKMPIAGLIFSSTVAGDEEMEQDNMHVICRTTKIPMIGHIPFIENITEQLKDRSWRLKLIATWHLNILEEGLQNESTKIV